MPFNSIIIIIIIKTPVWLGRDWNWVLPDLRQARNHCTIASFHMSWKEVNRSEMRKKKKKKKKRKKERHLRQRAGDRFDSLPG